MRAALWVLVLVVGVFAAFGPSLSGEWLRWDDDRNFLDHAAWRGLSPAHLGWMFTTFHQGPYQPLSWLTLAVDHAVWGMDPFGYHLTNLILHAATAAAFYFLARRLLHLGFARAGARVPSAARLDAGAFVAAALFAWHPLRCESVAWITERRDVLSGLFLVASVALYLRAQSEPPTRRWFVLCVVFFAASLLAKGLGMTLPVVLVVLDVFVLRRWNGAFVGGAPDDAATFALRPASVSNVEGAALAQVAPCSLAGLVREKWALWALALAAAALAWYGQKHHASVVSWQDHTFPERVAQSFYGLSYYAAKFAWPTDLTPLLVLPREIDLFSPRFAVPAVAVLATAVALWFLRRRAPSIVAAALAYAVFAAPVLGLTQAGPQLVADRYSYWPTTALALVAGAGFVAWIARRPGHFVPAFVGACAVLAASTSTSHRQSRVWHDTISVWEQAARVSPDSVDAHRNVTVSYLRAAEKHPDPARRIELYERGLAAAARAGEHVEEPGVISNEVSLMMGLAELDPVRAESLMVRAHERARLAVSLTHDDPVPVTNAFENHALLSIRSNRLDEALTSLEWLNRHDPTDANFALMLGQTLVLAGRPTEALAALERVQRLDPRTPVPWMEAGNVLRSLGRNDEARRAYEHGIELARALRPEDGVTPEVLAEWTQLLDDLPR